MQESFKNLPEGTKIIFFDGICNLCDNFVQLVIKNDPKKIFRFCSLQSSSAKTFLNERNLNSTNLDSIILYEPNKAYYVKSTAALHILKDLKFPYPFLYYLKIFPEKLRDSIYDFVAKNRYKWMGKKETCMIPSPEIKTLFIE